MYRTGPRALLVEGPLLAGAVAEDVSRCVPSEGL